MQYDLLVIGDGPEGHDAAITAARMNKRVAVAAELRDRLNGVCRHAGQVPSKTLREAVRSLSARQHRDSGEFDCGTRPIITMDEVRRIVAKVQQREQEVVLDQLNRNGVDLLAGEARFVDSHTVEVVGPNGRTAVESENILVASGTRAARPDRIPFDGKQVFESDDVLTMADVPRSLTIVGGGMTGVEYAILFAALGVDVTLVDRCNDLLVFCDPHISEALLRQARSLGVTFRLGEEVIGADLPGRNRAAVYFESGARFETECVLFSMGRVGRTEGLNLPAAGIDVDECGCLWCNDDQQTWISHIYGAGDVVGFPPLAGDGLPGATIASGRRAVCHMFGEAFEAGQPIPPDRSAISPEEFQWPGVDSPTAPAVESFPPRSRSMAVRRSSGRGARQLIR